MKLTIYGPPPEEVRFPVVTVLIGVVVGFLLAMAVVVLASTVSFP